MLLLEIFAIIFSCKIMNNKDSRYNKDTNRYNINTIGTNRYKVQ